MAADTGVAALHAELAAAEQALVGLQSLDRATALASATAQAPVRTAPTAPSGTATVEGKSLRGFDAGQTLSEGELAAEMVTMRETHAKIMAQNIALLADVEAMTEALTRMRGEKAVLTARLQQLSQ